MCRNVLLRQLARQSAYHKRVSYKESFVFSSRPISVERSHTQFSFGNHSVHRWGTPNLGTEIDYSPTSDSEDYRLGTHLTLEQRQVWMLPWALVTGTVMERMPGSHSRLTHTAQGTCSSARGFIQFVNIHSVLTYQGWCVYIELWYLFVPRTYLRDTRQIHRLSAQIIVFSVA